MVLKPMLKASIDENLSKIHVEYTEKLVDLERKERETLYKLEAYIGVESRGLLSGVENWKKKQALDKRYAAYGKGVHLKKTFKAYSLESRTLTKPFVDWYNVKIPELVLPAVDPVVGVESPIILNMDDPTVPLVPNSNAKKT